MLDRGKISPDTSKVTAATVSPSRVRLEPIKFGGDCQSFQQPRL